ncbi:MULTISPECIES: hypothetical protein [Fusobacterium]|uniref:hypothetical protein n=1 Tax=Fusobacterium TaxID=848 RepID=UPI001477559C|nr:MULTISPECIES: hypothetical protein [Fusobacterium]NME35476.1 hypothetical protein [Fusobacterium sp. FSA-380-WT-3A]
MKKISFLIIFLLFIGCSNVQNKNTDKINNLKICEKYCDNWELEKLESELQKIQNKDLEKKFKECLEEKKFYKKELDNFLRTLTISIKNNQILEIEDRFENNISNRKIIDILKNSNFSGVNIVFSKPKFYKKTAKNKVAFLFLEEVIYLSLEYEIIDGEWRITRVKDGRE